MFLQFLGLLVVTGVTFAGFLFITNLLQTLSSAQKGN